MELKTFKDTGETFVVTDEEAKWMRDNGIEEMVQIVDRVDAAIIEYVNKNYPPPRQVPGH